MNQSQKYEFFSQARSRTRSGWKSATSSSGSTASRSPKRACTTLRSRLKRSKSRFRSKLRVATSLKRSSKISNRRGELLSIKRRYRQCNSGSESRARRKATTRRIFWEAKGKQRYVSGAWQVVCSCRNYHYFGEFLNPAQRVIAPKFKQPNYSLPSYSRARLGNLSSNKQADGQVLYSWAHVRTGFSGQAFFRAVFRTGR